MELNILKAALEHYAQSADCSNDDRSKVLSAIESCTRTIDCLDYADSFEGSCYVMSASTLSDLLNLTTYDWYGKLQRQHGESLLPFDIYAAECRKYIDGVTDEQLELGYDIVSDLWLDNEAAGDNNTDGTFKHTK